MITTVVRSAVEPVKQTRGGLMHSLLTPKSAGTTAGYLGTLALGPGEVFVKHYHPYSEECLFIVSGELTIENDKSTVVARAGTGVFIPKLEPHRLRNAGSEETLIVYFCSPLAPSPEQGHVTLE